MIHPFLHDLDKLPQHVRVCILGKKGRNSRFEKILHSLRPDVRVVSPIAIENSGSVPSRGPSDEESRDAIHSCDFVLITLSKQKEFRAFLEKWGLKRYFFVNPNFYHPFFQPESKNAAYVDKLSEAKDLFCFPEDRIIYDLILSSIQVRKSLEETYYRLNDLYGRMGRQYFDFIRASEIQTVIEGGVADGRNTVEFLGGFPNPTIYGFEPDFGVFQESYFRRFLEDNPRVHILPLGLWHRTERLPFHIRGAETSQISLDSDSDCNGYIETISIDEFVSGRGIAKVDFIKMDIEGSELNALSGAKETLYTHRPQLAVCIYHQLEHYYEIPLFLAQHTKDYVFRIGHYSPLHVFSETVLYGIPREMFKA